MLIPRDMKGLEKSMTFSLSEVMVKLATARSAFWRGEGEVGGREGGREGGAGGRSKGPELGLSISTTIALGPGFFHPGGYQGRGAAG